jgi:hypothetical protein
MFGNVTRLKHDVAGRDVDDQHGHAGSRTFFGQRPTEATLDGDLGLVPAVEVFLDGQVEAVASRVVLEGLVVDAPVDVKLSNGLS